MKPNFKTFRPIKQKALEIIKRPNLTKGQTALYLLNEKEKQIKS